MSTLTCSTVQVELDAMAAVFRILSSQKLQQHVRTSWKPGGASTTRYMLMQTVSIHLSAGLARYLIVCYSIVCYPVEASQHIGIKLHATC